MAQEIMHEDVLIALPKYIGAQPFDDTDAGQDQVIKLAGFIRKYYPTVSPQKLEEIFEQAATGMLGAVSVATYGKQIGIDLLSTVLNAWKVIESRKVKITQPKDDIQPRSRKEHYEELKEYRQENQALPSLRFWSLIHDYLVEQKQLPAIRKPKSTQPRGRAARTLGEALMEKEVSDAKYKEALRLYFIKDRLI